MSIHSNLKIMRDALALHTREDDSTYWSYDHDTTPQWVQDACMAAHEGNLPNDSTFCAIVEALDLMLNADPSADADALREELYNFEPDIYTTNLTAWLAERLDHVGFVDAAAEAYGMVAQGGIAAMIGAGQALQIETVGGILLDAAVAQTEREESDEG